MNQPSGVLIGQNVRSTDKAASLQDGSAGWMVDSRKFEQTLGECIGMFLNLDLVLVDQIHT